MTKAAIKLQKFYRGHRGRRSADPRYISNIKRTIRGQFRVLRESNFQLNYHTGQVPEIASKVIQKFVKRFLLYRKILRIQHTYKVLQKENMYRAFALIRRHIYVFKARNKIKWKKFKILRVFRMQQLRFNLALLVVKNYWVRNKMTMKLLNRNIRKYKRKLQKAAQLAELADKKGQIESKLMDIQYSVMGDDQQEKIQNMQALLQIEQDQAKQQAEDSQQQQRLQRLQAQKKHKIKMGKVSYCIPIIKNKKYLPKLKKPQLEQPKDALQQLIAKMKTQPEPKVQVPIPPQYLHLAQRLFDTNGQPVFMTKQPNQTIKKKQNKPNSRQGRRNRGSSPNYMKPTSSSKRNRFDAEPNSPQQEDLPNVPEKRADSTLMQNTEAFNKKRIAGRSVSIDNRPVWKPGAVAINKYLPGIDNRAYIPKFTQFKKPRCVSRPSRLKPLTLSQIKPDVQAPMPPETDIVILSPRFALTLESFSCERESPLQKPMTVKVKPRIDTMRGYMRHSPQERNNEF